MYKIIESSAMSQKQGTSKYAIILDSSRFDYVYIDKFHQHHFDFIEKTGIENLTQNDLEKIYCERKKKFNWGRIMLKVTLSDYTVIYAKTIGEALEKTFKLGQNIRFID